MGIAKLLEDGIFEENWDLIRQAYEELTGNTIEKNTVKYQDPVEPAEEKAEEESYIHTIRKPGFKPKQVAIDPLTGEEKVYCSMEPVNKNKISTVGNLWTPDEYDDVEKDPKNGYAPKKAKQKKKPVKFVKVNCVMCGKAKEIHPMFNNKESGYTCDKCIISKRRVDRE